MKIHDININKLRRDKSISQQKVSELSGIPQPHISRIEKGVIKIDNLTINTVECILNAIGYQLEIKPIEPETTNWKKLL